MLPVLHRHVVYHEVKYRGNPALKGLHSTAAAAAIDVVVLAVAVRLGVQSVNRLWMLVHAPNGAQHLYVRRRTRHHTDAPQQSIVGGVVPGATALPAAGGAASAPFPSRRRHRLGISLCGGTARRRRRRQQQQRRRRRCRLVCMIQCSRHHTLPLATALHANTLAPAHSPMTSHDGSSSIVPGTELWKRVHVCGIDVRWRSCGSFYFLLAYALVRALALQVRPAPPRGQLYGSAAARRAVRSSGSGVHPGWEGVGSERAHRGERGGRPGVHNPHAGVVVFYFLRSTTTRGKVFPLKGVRSLG
mmetsp:Transcript_2543/g.6059  ORF Transcript_2543/g.6059 Transcript_2543/m.6059 type:complete len:302 (+) Transcript_2543:1657-2562(+)